MTVSLGVVVGGVYNLEGEQNGAVVLVVGEIMDKLESSIKELTSKMSPINVERNFNPGKNNQRQTNRKQFKYVPLNTTEYTEPTENFTNSSL